MFIIIGIYFTVYTVSQIYFFTTYNTYVDANLNELTILFLQNLEVGDTLGSFLNRLKAFCTQNGTIVQFNLDPKISYDYSAIDKILKNIQEELNNSSMTLGKQGLINTCKNIQHEIKITLENQSVMHGVMKALTSPTFVVSLFSIYATLRILLGM